MRGEKSIMPFNEKGQNHGYWEVYWNSINMREEGNYINGKKDDLWCVYENGEVIAKYYHI